MAANIPRKVEKGSSSEPEIAWLLLSMLRSFSSRESSSEATSLGVGDDPGGITVESSKYEVKNFIPKLFSKRPCISK